QQEAVRQAAARADVGRTAARPFLSGRPASATRPSRADSTRPPHHLALATPLLLACPYRAETQPMTPDDWDNSYRPQAMLEALPRRDEVSDRRLRLFACACCRLAWHLLPGLPRRLVALVERHADGELGPADLAALFRGYQPQAVSS